MHLVSCTNTHHDVTDLVNHGMVKNTKTWISWERNIIFLWSKKILNLGFRWHILRSYRFLAEVTFKLEFGTQTNFNLQNSMVMFTLSLFDQKYPFFWNLFQKTEIVCWSLNLEPRLIRICRIQQWFSFFYFLGWNYPFWVKMIQKFKIVILGWNIVPRLFQICQIWWSCSLFQ